MNLKDPRHPWSRLVAAKRQELDERDVATPYGFATRVVALAFTQRRKVSSLVERFAVRAFGVACLLAIVSVAVNYRELTHSAPSVVVAEEYALPPDDAVAVVLDLTD